MQLFTSHQNNTGLGEMMISPLTQLHLIASSFHRNYESTSAFSIHCIVGSRYLLSARALGRLTGRCVIGFVSDNGGLVGMLALGKGEGAFSSF